MSSSRQLNLFGDPAPEPDPKPKDRAPVGPAAVPDELREIASSLPDDVRFGTSSWSFPGWEGLVYDREATKRELAREGLAAYSRHPLLRAVGVDRTYYAPVSADTFAGYARAVPDDFRFLVKALNLCTMPRVHDRGRGVEHDNALFLDADFAAREIVRPYVDGLRDRAGTLLFQFPPLGDALTGDPPAFAERLAGFLGRLPEGPRYSVELRDSALVTSDYFAALDDAGAHHCFSVHPRLPPIDEQRELAGGPKGPLFVRWMLRDGLRYKEAVERYEPFSEIVDEDVPNRSHITEICLEHALAGHPVIVVANNKAEGSAPVTLTRLAQRLWRNGFRGDSRRAVHRPASGPRSPAAIRIRRSTQSLRRTASISSGSALE